MTTLPEVIVTVAVVLFAVVLVAVALVAVALVAVALVAVVLVEESSALVAAVLTLVVVEESGDSAFTGAKTFMLPLPPHICIAKPGHGMLQSAGFRDGCPATELPHQH